MNQDDVKSIYSMYSSVYDRLFGHFFRPRIKVGINRSHFADGDKIIEVGVGTGLSLPLYPRECEVVGIDLTSKMLDQARRKKERYDLTHVNLMEMDAERMTFADDTFDHAVAAFVVTVVPNPEKMVAEMKRVTKKNGVILIFNHFCSNGPVLGPIERFFSPVFEKWAGWRMGVPIELLSNHCNLDIKEVFKKNKLDLWSIVIANNNK